MKNLFLLLTALLFISATSCTKESYSSDEESLYEAPDVNTSSHAKSKTSSNQGAGGVN